jgi:hypothetical protein
MDKTYEYLEALIKLDELSKMLGETLRMMRIEWDDDSITEDGILNPINQIARQIGEAIPPEIKAAE